MQLQLREHGQPGLSVVTEQRHLRLGTESKPKKTDWENFGAVIEKASVREEGIFFSVLTREGLKS